MMPTAITVTIHPQFGVSDEILLFTLTIGSTTGDGVSVELLIWTGVAFAFGVGEVVGVYEVEVVGSVEAGEGVEVVAGADVA